MYGPDVNSLGVYVNTTTLGPLIWSRNGTQGNAWRLANVDIQMSQSYSVSLQTYAVLPIMIMFIVQLVHIE